ncbi:MAG: fibrobacter succinogenes major paralogous domain-containing protein, partial [Prevotellaceae bacterium]|nr:fibrobacter succinogenes major paralogous domain-containing protein [Prevotellaceae bacterium]
YRTNDGGSSWVAGTQSSGWTNSATNYSTGLKIGDALVLPVAGSRNDSNGSLGSRGSIGYYWSSTATGTNGYYLYFSSGGQYTFSSNRSCGFSVRCLSE